MILTANICSCKVLDVPPVSEGELESLIRYRLTSFYPGDVEDLKIDFIRVKERVIVFYLSQNVYQKLVTDNPREKFYTVYHLTAQRKNPPGIFYFPVNKRLEVLEYDDRGLREFYSLPDSESNRSKLEKRGGEALNREDFSPPKGNSLFSGRKKSNYTAQILGLIVLIVFLPQLFYYRQIRSEEKYLEDMEKKTEKLMINNSLISTSEEEMKVLEEKYNSLVKEKPLSLYLFLSDLSTALGPDTEIESLVLKDRSFQMNGVGFNTLGKMENFQNDRMFSSVIPYQVRTVEGSRRERFSLTGFYDYE